jgi:hypothetical protein
MRQATKILRAPNPVIHDHPGTPIAVHNSDGTEYYFLFDGQGNVVGLEDPGTMVASYTYCPTGNAAPLNGEQPTQAALNNPLRQGGRMYDDNTKTYVGSNGVITEDYSGVGTQTAGLAFGDALYTFPASGSTVAFGPQQLSFRGAMLAESGPSCDASSNPEASSADTAGCSVTQDTTGEASASAGGGSGGGSGEFTVFPGEPHITLPPPEPHFQESVAPAPEQPTPEQVDPENLPWPSGAPLPIKVGWVATKIAQGFQNVFGGG